MKVFAHRGASGQYPENTLLAFEQAIIEKTDGIELDVQYHRLSGQLIILHNNTLDKTTNGQGSINDYSLTDLQQLDAGQGQIVPTLLQALALINGRCDVNIELKSSNSDTFTIDAIGQELINTIDFAIAHHHFQPSNFITSSFNHPLIAAIKRTAPQLLIGVLIASCPINYATCAENLSAYSIHPSIDMLNEAFVEDAHKRGLKVWVYTVDKHTDIKYCQQLNIDGIFTNFPLKTKEYLVK